MSVIASRPVLPEPVLGDPDVLGATAAGFEVVADAMAVSGIRVSSAIEAVRWVGAAADARRVALTRTANDARVGSRAADEASVALRQLSVVMARAQNDVAAIRTKVSHLQGEFDRLAVLSLGTDPVVLVAVGRDLEDVATQSSALGRVAAERHEDLERAITRALPVLAGATVDLERIAASDDQPVPAAPPAPSSGDHHWWDTFGENVSATADLAGAVGSALFVDPVVQDWETASSVVDYYLANPGQLAKTTLDSTLLVGGVYLAAAGAAGEIGGTALDLTGVGVPVGVPLNIASAGVIALGATGVGAGASGLSDDMTTMQSGRSHPGSHSGTGGSNPSGGKTKQEITQQAGDLGYKRRVPPQKAPFDSHGQPAYTDERHFITPDADGHNVSNGWKMYTRRGQRKGTYTWDLAWVKD